MKIEGLHCPNCGELIIQITKRRIQHYCNRDCYEKWYDKVGGFRKGMKKYLSKPENQEKNRKRANKYHIEQRRIKNEEKSNI